MVQSCLYTSLHIIPLCKDWALCWVATKLNVLFGPHSYVNVIIDSIRLCPGWKVKMWKEINHGPFKYFERSSSNVLCSGFRGIVASCLNKMHLQITSQMRAGGSKQGFPLMIICLRKNKTQQWQDWNTSEHTSINMDKHLQTKFTQPLGCSFIADAFTADTNGVARRKLHCCPPRSDATTTIRGGFQRSVSVCVAAVWTWSREAKQQTLII